MTINNSNLVLLHKLILKFMSRINFINIRDESITKLKEYNLLIGIKIH